MVSPFRTGPFSYAEDLLEEQYRIGNAGTTKIDSVISSIKICSGKGGNNTGAARAKPGLRIGVF